MPGFLKNFVTVKYCGGCNSQIDRSGLIDALENRFGLEILTSQDHNGLPTDIGLFVCRCSAACAVRPKIRNLARHWIVVAGSAVDCQAVAETDLAAAVATRIKWFNDR